MSHAFMAAGVKFGPGLPSGWTLRRVKDIATIVNGYPFDSARFSPEGQHPLVRIRDISSKDTETRFDGEWMDCAAIDAGDVLIGMDGEFNVHTWKGGPALLNQRVCCARGESSLITRYLAYALPIPLKVMNDLTYFTTVKHLSSVDVGRIVLPVPPQDRLGRVVELLDEQTARIDALILEKRRAADNLAIASVELIHHAVTKGLRKQPMKASGRDWIGEIPAHWSSPYIRFVARLESGHTPSRQHPEYWENCQIPWFTLGDVWQIRDGQRESVTETGERISELGLANSAARVLPAGTVMLSRTASVGFSAIMGIPMATTQDFANWVCGDRVLPQYLLYVLRAMGSEFERLKFGSTHQTIYMPDIARLSMPLPPIDEQVEIVQAVRERKSSMDELRASASAAVRALSEYRSSLVASIVAGHDPLEAHNQ